MFVKTKIEQKLFRYKVGLFLIGVIKIENYDSCVFASSRNPLVNSTY